MCSSDSAALATGAIQGIYRATGGSSAAARLRFRALELELDGGEATEEGGQQTFY